MDLIIDGFKEMVIFSRAIKYLFANRQLFGNSNVPLSKCSKKSLAVVIPTLNEEKNLICILKYLKKLGYNNIIVIDGKSKDNTVTVAKQNGAKIFLQDGRGKGRAIRQVLSVQLADFLEVDSLLMMDADGSMNPQEIPRFVHALANGADVVKGSRFVGDGFTYDMDAFRRFGNTIFTIVVNLLFDTHYTDLCYGFVLFNRGALEKLGPLLISDNFDIEAEIFIKAKKLGLNVVEVPSVEYKRLNGVSNLGAFKDGSKILIRIISEIFN